MRDDESVLDYWVRLYEEKDALGLTCEEIASLLNAVNGTDYGECKWRKDYAMFSKGREYERSLRDGGHVADRILCLSDFHVPFQLPVDTFADYAGRVDTLVISGDATDCYAISKFPKAYRNSPMEEIIQTRQYFIKLIELVRPNRVIVIYGNHDIRFEAYFAKNLDSDLIELMPRTSLELIVNDGFNHYDKAQRSKIYYPPIKDVFDDVDISYIDNWYVQVGDTIFAHPIAFSGGIMKTADKAVQYFQQIGADFKQISLAHTHRVGMYKEGSITLYEQGCCCDVMKMHYSDGKLTAPQKEGFLYLCQDDNGHTICERTKLVSLN